MPGVQDGVSMREISGLMGGFKHLDQQSARQDGVTWEDTVWEAAEIDIGITISGRSARAYRITAHNWINSWDTRTQGRLCFYSRQYGEWWTDLRLLKQPGEVFKNSPASMTMQDFTWAARADLPFWTSFDSVSALVANSPTNLADPKGVGAPNFLPLWNRGDQDGWARFVLRGPGTFTFGDGVSNNTVAFGPVPAGVQVLVTTLPRLRAITEINTGVNMYELLTGRFTTPIPRGRAVHIPCKVTGAVAAQTKVIASLTPYRRWPE
ncbi:hypothetical protein F5X71_34580 [Nocardia brasiliensis]|uniref:Uncharacterized protein n=1 Tax=Nocardia brasiliensis TaxID=37326 RepID=A0A6G9Y113_NOCBR|nr:hypothetical protein [Nocardia brasiliensis]QIS06753.1 hypothetical protein F5X71_34580 [Nocardia brasiliensis]